MSQFLDQPPPPPSWIPPIAVGSLFTLMVMFGTAGLEILPVPVACFCCAIQPLPVGVLPAIMALRRDPDLTVGQGFAVSFIAVGLGAAVSTLMVIARWDSAQSAEVERVMRQSLEEMNAASPGEQLSIEEIDQMVAGAVEIAPYTPAVMALILTVLAGFVGLLTVVLLRRRRLSPPPMMAPPPDDAHYG